MKTKKIAIFILLLATGLQCLLAEKTKTTDSEITKEVKVIKNNIPANTKDSILYEKLSADQLLELKKEENQLRMEEIQSASKDANPLNAPAIVMIVLIPFIFTVIILLVIGNIKGKESSRRYDLYKKSLEMGQPIPEHFFEEPAKKDTVSNLKKGILWLSVGLSIVISTVVMNEVDAAFLGIIPAFVGLGYLLVHLLDKPKNNASE